jgi:hypothetical protein
MENDKPSIDTKFDDADIARHVERLEKSPPQPKYIAQKNIIEQIDRSFTFHPATDDQRDRYIMIREASRKLARKGVESTPPSREQSLALTHLEQAVMWFNAAIARNE